MYRNCLCLLATAQKCLQMSLNFTLPSNAPAQHHLIRPNFDDPCSIRSFGSALPLLNHHGDASLIDAGRTGHPTVYEVTGQCALEGFHFTPRSFILQFFVSSSNRLLLFQHLQCTCMTSVLLLVGPAGLETWYIGECQAQ